MIVEVWRDIFDSLVGVPQHCPIKHSIYLIFNSPLPSDPIYIFSLLENEEIKHFFHELIQKGHIQSRSLPCWSQIVLVQKKDGTWRFYINYRAMKKIFSRTDIRSPILMIFFINLSVPISLVRLAWT